MNDRMQRLLAQLDQLVAGLEDIREKCRAECSEVGFDNEIKTPLTNGLIDVARGFLEVDNFDLADSAMQRVEIAATLEWDLIELQSALEDLKEEQNKESK